ncbi:MAG: DUF2071 domain-containing protein [Verrucomicrobiota bacterium]
MEALGPVVMRQRWESLLFLHWEMPTDSIQEMLPEGLYVDTYSGQAYIGVVPFLMRKVRPRFLFCVPGISNFLELNLRTYVVDDEGRKGVWFFSLDANQRLAVWIARKCFALPYYFAKMKYKRGDDGFAYFDSYRAGSAAQRFGYQKTSKAEEAREGSFSHFLVERYSLFSSDEQTGRLYLGHIRHRPYRLATVEISSYSEELFKLSGFECPGRLPDHQIYAEPVDVDIHPMRRLR